MGTYLQPKHNDADIIRYLTVTLSTQDFGRVQSYYNPGALLIPPTADQFIPGTQVGAFFKEVYASGLVNLSLVPTMLSLESPTLYHEIGLVSDSGSPNPSPYYVRWIKPAAGADWQVAVDIMAIGAPEAASAATAAGPPTKNEFGDDPAAIIAAKDKALAAAYNSQDFAGCQAFYNPGALIVPPTADAFVPGTGAADFFKAAYASGLHNLSLAPQMLHQESATLIHEIGLVGDSMSPAPGPYYVHWVKPAGADWQIAFDIMAIGGA